MHRKWWMGYSVRPRFLIEPGDGAAGGSGGGGAAEGDGAGKGGDEGAGKGGEGEGAGKGGEGEGGAGASGTAGDEGTPKGGSEGAGGALPADVQAELTRLKALEAKASQHLEVDPTTGEYRLRKVAEAPQWTAEQIRQAQMENSIAEKSAQLIEQNRTAETKTIEKFKAKDPLFAENFLKAREKMLTLPAAQRTEQVWERAYSMAAGEAMLSGKVEKHYRELGKQEALQNLDNSGTMVLPAGSGRGQGSKDGKPDLSKVTLSREERAAGLKFIEAGMLSSLDEYKANLLELQPERGG